MASKFDNLASRISHSGLFWIIIQGFLILFFYAWSGKLKLVHEGDSVSYLFVAQLDSLEAWLTDMRTFGYPLFLRVISTILPDFAWLPCIHLGFHILSVVTFWWGLKAYGFADRQALLGASPLLYVEAVGSNVAFLLSDSLAVSWAILTIALLLVVTASPSRKFVWLCLVTSCFVTYQIRPAYLYLIPLLPFLGWSLHWHRGVGKDWIRLRKLLLGLTAAGIGPYLAFCVFRWVMVGDFGLVSFGGWVQTGITSQMLDEKLVEELPEDMRDLGRAIVAQRKNNADIVRRGDKAEIDRLVESLTFRSRYFSTITNREDFVQDCIACAEPLLGGTSFSLHAWSHCYNYSAITLAMSTAIRVYGTDFKVLNQKLGRLSRVIIFERPILFAKWVVKAFVQGINGLLGDHRVVWSGDSFVSPTFILALLLLSSDMVLISRSFFTAHCRSGPPSVRPADDWARLFALVMVIGLPFYCTGTLLVVLVQPPLSRYVWPPASFLPILLPVALVWKWTVMRSALKSN